MNNIYSTKSFTYDPYGRTFVTCASDLDVQGNLFSRLYNDAYDVGLFLLSERTGRVATYYLDRREVDEEGDLRTWHLLPTLETVCKFPKLADTKIIIFND